MCTLTLEELSSLLRDRQGSLVEVIWLTGLPAISVPCGFSSKGLPIGLQLAGRAWDEATVLRAAYAYETATYKIQNRGKHNGKEIRSSD